MSAIERMDELWRQMGRMYGHRWASAYGDYDHDNTWAKATHDLTDEEMQAGFYACLHSGDAWPPSAPEFRARCRPPVPKRENAAAYRVPSARWLSQQLSAEKRAHGRACIADLKAMVTGK